MLSVKILYTYWHRPCIPASNFPYTAGVSNPWHSVSAKTLAGEIVKDSYRSSDPQIPSRVGRGLVGSSEHLWVRRVEPFVDDLVGQSVDDLTVGPDDRVGRAVDHHWEGWPWDHRMVGEVKPALDDLIVGRTVGWKVGACTFGALVFSAVENTDLGGARNYPNYPKRPKLEKWKTYEPSGWWATKIRIFTRFGNPTLFCKGTWHFLTISNNFNNLGQFNYPVWKKARIIK